MDNQVVVIIPGYNESKNLKELFSRIKKTGNYKILFVDDGSKDDSLKIAEEEGIQTLKMETNSGKGAALRFACDYACDVMKPRYIALIDGDLQHKPSDIPRFIEQLEDVHMDVVCGYRKFSVKMPPIKAFGNRGINFLFHLLFLTTYKDVLSGYKVFRADVYESIRWKAPRYNIEVEIASLIIKNKLKYKQIPIETIYLDNNKGTTIFDGLKIGFHILKLRLGVVSL